MQRLYKTQDLADLSNLEPERIARLVKSGQLRAYLIDGELRIGEEDLERYLAGCVVQPAQMACSISSHDSAVMRPSDTSGTEQRRGCPTFGGQATFVYCGSVQTGTTVWPGQRTSYKLRFSAEQWSALLQAFRGKEVRAGLNFSHPEPGSFGEWIKIHWNTKMGPAAYVGGILINEGYAKRPRPGWIEVFAEPSNTTLKQSIGD